MTSKKVSLNAIDSVKKFVKIVSDFECDMDLVTERYVIDAKSIMGIFSIDLSKPIELRIHASDEEAEKVIDRLKEFIVE